MATSAKTLIELETKFWQSMVDQNADSALQLLHDPSQTASAHGAMKFDHAAYRKMAEQGDMVVTSFELSDVEVVFPTEAAAVLTHQVKKTVAAREGGKGGTQNMSEPLHGFTRASAGSALCIPNRRCKRSRQNSNFLDDWICSGFEALSEIRFD